jgi:hypothetical protein
MANPALAGGGKKGKPKLRALEGGAGSDSARLVPGGGGGGSDDPPATRSYVDSEIKAVRNDLGGRIDRLPTRREFYAAAITALLIVIGGGFSVFLMLREDLQRAETRAERVDDRIERRLDEISAAQRERAER